MQIHALYASLLKQGYSAKDAAKEVQSRTGLSAVTGKPINRQLNFKGKDIYNGQYKKI